MPAALRAQPPGQGPKPTFKIGDIPVMVKGTFEAEFNDNINYSNDDRAYDIILRPGIALGVNYKLTDINTVALQLGVSYEQYLIHPDLSSYTNFASVSPDSQLALTMRLGDTTTVTIYDSFNYSVQPSDALSSDPKTGQVITHIKAFGRFMNQIGVKGDWQATPETKLYGGVYRYDVFPQSADYDFLRRWQYTATAGVSRVFGAYTTSLDGSYTLNYYATNLENSSGSWYVAPTVTWVGSAGTVIKGTIGFTGYDFHHNGTNGDSSQPSTYTGELSATFPLTSLIDNTFTVSRSSSFGYVSNTITIDRISYKLEHKEFLLKNMVGSVLCYYERGRDSGGFLPERYEKFVISPQVDYSIRTGFSIYASYEFADKFSNFSTRNYLRNQFIIGVRYDF